MTLPIWQVGHGMPKISSDVDCIVLAISREEVEGLAVGRAVDDLMTLSDSTRLRRQLAHGVMFCFTGWDEDPREVAAIPACRAYLQALHAHWGYWLHFLAPLPDLWAVLLLCLVDGKPATDENGRPARRVDPAEVQTLVTGMLRTLHLLHHDMGLPEPERQRLRKVSLAAIGERWV